MLKTISWYHFNIKMNILEVDLWAQSSVRNIWGYNLFKGWFSIKWPISEDDCKWLLIPSMYLKLGFFYCEDLNPLWKLSLFEDSYDTTNKKWHL